MAASAMAFEVAGGIDAKWMVDTKEGACDRVYIECRE
jgi:hypothetical protein